MDVATMRRAFPGLGAARAAELNSGLNTALRPCPTRSTHSLPIALMTAPTTHPSRSARERSETRPARAQAAGSLTRRGARLPGE
jgi:hypothetical protein